MTSLQKGRQWAGHLFGFQKRRQEASRVAQRQLRLQAMPPVRIAVAGAGRYALRHLQVLSSFPNVELVGLCNRGNSDISELARQYRVKGTFSDYRKMAEETKPDAVVVVVSHFETVPVARYCLERGLSCLIEKPAGFRSADTAALAEVAAGQDCLNMVGVNRRYISTVQNALTLILSRGPLLGISIDAPEPIRAIRSRGEQDPRLYDLWLIGNTIHALDLFRCLGGEVVDLAGRKECREEARGDSFATVIRLSKGGLGVFTSHWLSVPGWSLTLYGVGAKAILSLATAGEVIFDSGERMRVPVDPVDLQFKPGLFAQDEAFVTALALKEKLSYPASDLADSARTMQLIEAIASAA